MINSNKESISEGPGPKKERPDFGPSQVRNLSELKPGMLLVKRRSDVTSIYGEHLMTLDLPFQKGNSWWMRTRIFVSGLVDRSSKLDIALADYGVVPYDNGLWNPSNWLEDPLKVANPDKNPT